MPSYGQDVVSHNWNVYLIFSSGMLNSILSQMCGRLYFPIFLLSVGLFTLMYIDSLIVLAKLLSSLPIILKFSIDVSWPLIFWCWNIGEGAFKCSLYLSPNERTKYIDDPLKAFLLHWQIFSIVQ